ncbi:amylo-alpha-1,6-glucosidase [Humibacter sp. RRB41]|uniref:amylo-alpha-1,6-glucosidase n=1 Tax=Humibacter sp. RRB41 TaxID=2919946 RepID=UPI001FA9DA13|nr:glycogen debranching protein [Humibacter sp. RRB41]
MTTLPETETHSSTVRDDTALTFDVRSIPFSRRGSWLDLSPVVALQRTEADIHLVSHTTGMHAVLRLTPRTGEERADASLTGTAASLLWRTPAGTVEAVFETTDAIRFRGRGLGMRFAEAATELTPFTGTYLYSDPIDGSAVYTSYETGRRYRITPLEGEIAIVGAQSLGAAERRVEAGGDAWELVVEEFETARAPYRARQSFEEARDLVAEEFNGFLGMVAPRRLPSAPATSAAAYVLWSATVAPAGFLEREGVLMSKHWMDKVWSWDHCFNALALADGAPELALDQFMLPFDHQTDEGALPDSVTHSEVLYNYVKPPIHGWAFTALRRVLPASLVLPQLPEIYRRLAAWSRFWLDCRRVPGHALPHYQHGNDSGWDNATTFDVDRVVESPDLAAFLLIQLRVLADLARELGGDTAADASLWSAAAAEVETGLGELWRGDGYVAVAASGGQEAKRRSLLTLLPIILGETLGPEASMVLANGVSSHLTSHGVATEPVESEDYQSDGYWRGPIWAPSTVLVEDGLRRAGHVELADSIRARFLRLCEKSGFAENFDAITGQGLRDRAYTWTASAYLLFARDDLR